MYDRDRKKPQGIRSRQKSIVLVQLSLGICTIGIGKGRKELKVVKRQMYLSNYHYVTLFRSLYSFEVIETSSSVRESAETAEQRV